MESYERFLEFLKSNAVSSTVTMETATALQIKQLNNCREERSCLFWTLIILSSTTDPYLKIHLKPHEFLSAVYTEYEIMIWSSTSMKWVELKMGQLGVLDNPNHKITTLLDHLAMITVQSDSTGPLLASHLALYGLNFLRTS